MRLFLWHVAVAMTAILSPLAAAVPDLSYALSMVEHDLKRLAHDVPAPEPTPSWHFATISDLHNELLKKPEFPTNYQTPIIPYEEVIKAMTAVIDMARNEHERSTWVGRKPRKDIYTNPQLFDPYAQKLIVPVGARLDFWGDTHGSAESLLSDLERLMALGVLKNDFTVVDPKKQYLIFLGDYVDRGMYGIEVMYIVARLKQANPHNVFMVRGNHEDAKLNVRYEFTDELTKKYPDENYIEILTFYNALPVVLYVGSGTKTINCLQCCHGGMELGYDPGQLLVHASAQFECLEILKRKTYVLGEGSFGTGKKVSDEFALVLREKLDSDELDNIEPLSPMRPVLLGFMWNDFAKPRYSIEYAVFNHWRNGGQIFGLAGTQELLTWGDNASVRLQGVVRAHQHNDSMEPELPESGGAFPLWDGLVLTLFSGPGNFLPPHPGHPIAVEYAFDSFCELTTAQEYKDWKWRHHWRRIKVGKDGTWNKPLREPWKNESISLPKKARKK